MIFELPESVKAALSTMREDKAAALAAGLPWCDAHERPMVETPVDFECPACVEEQRALSEIRHDLDDDIPFKVLPPAPVVPPVKREEALFGVSADPQSGDVKITLPDPSRDGLGKFHADAGPTEYGAAVAALPRTGTQRYLVLEAIATAPDGRTDEEIAALPHTADTAHRTRRNELVADGWVEDSGRTRPTSSGSPSIVWVLTSAGRTAWDAL